MGASLPNGAPWRRGSAPLDRTRGLIVHEQAEPIARYARGKFLARSAARSGNVAVAEDAFSEALLAALRAWPVAGIPDHPEAWVFTAASRRSQACQALQ